MKLKNIISHRSFYKAGQRALAVIVSGVFLLTGCGNHTELDNYKANMNQFFENVKVFDSSINALDPDSETAVSDLLSILDTMDKSFAQMASLEVPDGFPGVEELADEASAYMTQAVSYYHQAYEAEPFDTVLADVAKQNYDRANVRVQYILSILHGDIPEEIYTYEEDSSGEDAAAADTAEDSGTVDDTDTAAEGDAAADDTTEGDTAESDTSAGEEPAAE